MISIYTSSKQVLSSYLDNVDIDLFITSTEASSSPRWIDIASKSIIRALECANAASRYSDVSNVVLVGLRYLVKE